MICVTCGGDMEKNSPKTAASCFKCRMANSREARRRQKAWMQAHASGRLTPEMREEMASVPADHDDTFVVWDE